jgi:hypothetical protein
MQLYGIGVSCGDAHGLACCQGSSQLGPDGDGLRSLGEWRRVLAPTQPLPRARIQPSLGEPCFPLPLNGLGLPRWRGLGPQGPQCPGGHGLRGMSLALAALNPGTDLGAGFDG